MSQRNDISSHFWYHLSNKEKYTILMDNSSVHGKLIRDFINSTSHTILYTPPYSLQYNPIEECFNQLKHYIRKRKPERIYNLKQVIDESITKINYSKSCR